MAKLIKKLLEKGRKSAKKAYDNAETKLMAAVGRRSVRGKVRTVGKASRRIAKSAATAAAFAAAGAILQELRRRNRD